MNYWRIKNMSNQAYGNPIGWHFVECPDCGRARDPEWQDCYYCDISEEERQKLFEEMWSSHRWVETQKELPN
jgi:hypothetical protein